MSPRTPSEMPSHSRPWLRVLGRWLRLVVVLGLLATVLQSTTALSQIGPGASLTVVRGSVSVTRSDGTAMVMGLVPSRASRPPKGATALGERPESAVISAIMPACAARMG